MSARGMTYPLPEGWDFEQARTALEAGFRLRAEAVQRLGWSCYDSFDWRLYQARKLLKPEQQGRDRRLLWCDQESEAVHETLRLGDGMPRFAWDLPEGLTRSQLEAREQFAELFAAYDAAPERLAFEKLLSGKGGAR